MKKYHQLLLVLISIISISLLLIYRHEYNRLRYVLEVFNFFGRPDNCSYPELLNLTNTIQHDWGPVPVWVTEENFATYSAFLQNEKEVETIIVHKITNVIISSCFLWFEESTKPILGKIHFSKVKEIDENLAFFKYSCHSTGDSVNVPYAVSFAEKKRTPKQLKKIMLKPLSRKSFELSTICVIPSEGYSRQQIVEFISFHKNIGINSFIFYNNNISYKFLGLLQKISLKLGIEIINYPWNFPYESSDTRKMIEEDCKLRTRNISKEFTILDWREILVPKYHVSITALLDSYDSLSSTNVFELKTLVFCIDYNKNDKDPSILHNSYLDNTKNAANSFIYRNNAIKNNVIHSQQIGSSIAVVYKYVYCDAKSNRTKVNNEMMRFKKDLMKSVLYKLFKYDRL